MNHLISRRNALSLLASGAGLASLGQSSWLSAEETVAAPTETSWSSFRNGPDQRGISRCRMSDNPKLKWQLESKDGWVATCAIVGNQVFAPSLSGTLFCLDRRTGQEIWQYRSIADPDPKKFAPGWKAAPLVTATAVYVGDEDGVLHAVSRQDGRLLWKYATDAEIAGGVAVFGDRLLLASHDSFLYCLDSAGQEQWKFGTSDRINCSPAVADHFTFVSGCDAHLRVIDLNDGSEVRDVAMNSYLIASPAVVDDALYVGSHGGEVTAVNWKTGEILWRYHGERDMPYHASAAVTDSLVLVGGHDKHLHAIDRASGKAAWTFATRARIECSGAIVGDRIYFGSGDGNLYGVSLTDGTEAWKFNGGKAINAGIAIGEGSLVVGEDAANGRLLCFE
ncbi:MAG: PQQ-binding-like beta-propeller repeat protein [Planctomycetaceae bacterium]